MSIYILVDSLNKQQVVHLESSPFVAGIYPDKILEILEISLANFIR